MILKKFTKVAKKFADSKTTKMASKLSQNSNINAENRKKNDLEIVQNNKLNLFPF